MVILLFRIAQILYHKCDLASMFPVILCRKEAGFVANTLLVYVYINIKTKEYLYV